MYMSNNGRVKVVIESCILLIALVIVSCLYTAELSKSRNVLKEENKNGVVHEEKKQSKIQEIDPERIAKETKKEKQESIYPPTLRNFELEKDFIGMLLNDPKLMAKYYILNEENYFDNKIFLEIYRNSIYRGRGIYSIYC